VQLVHKNFPAVACHSI